MNTNLPKLYQEALEYVKTYNGSQRQLARETGVSQKWISRFSRGEFKSPGIVNLERLIDHKNGVHHQETAA